MDLVIHPSIGDRARAILAAMDQELGRVGHIEAGKRNRSAPLWSLYHIHASLDGGSKAVDNY